MNKKRWAILSIVFLFSIMLVSLVSAADVGSVIKSTSDFFKPILESLFGESANLFEQLLFSLIIIAFVYMALSQIEVISDKPAVLWVVTIVSALLSVRFIANQKMVEALLVPGGVFGIAMIVLIPFVLFFWFVEFGLKGPGSRILRKIAWVVYGVIFTFIWFKQFYIPGHSEVRWAAPLAGNISETIPASLSMWGWLYIAVIVVSILLLLFDGTIQGAISKSKARTHIYVIKERRLARVRKEMKDAEKDLSGTDLTTELTRLKKEYEDILKS